ncbi:MAG: helix-turn-helix domain-containing protein [Oscillospiraceae bacterium]|nr:helix-turn-helix domain-containing protein [Oscillospiraceae bacterium]
MNKSVKKINEKEAQTIFLKSVGERIMYERKKLKWTQKEFAEKVGIDRKHVYNIESGKSAMTISVLGNVASALRTSTNYLVHGE